MEVNKAAPNHIRLCREVPRSSPGLSLPRRLLGETLTLTRRVSVIDCQHLTSDGTSKDK